MLKIVINNENSQNIILLHRNNDFLLGSTVIKNDLDIVEFFCSKFKSKPYIIPVPNIFKSFHKKNKNFIIIKNKDNLLMEIRKLYINEIIKFEPITSYVEFRYKVRELVLILNRYFKPYINIHIEE